ncbi:hypothetical protein AVMA1855_05950 [Acidovorax sp. SUPP1855]|uniref:hypothetical protein n=1 Tax=Acidovorax sp. SUPP1855 TaxID=431774 RepID=UPI0023DE553E|nr:hypothetical protein [Acidovorax sp. SUPP1855]GKS83664.1 hypothetical protein AVMA1855_05950 [Acidovorax sp. SUPP1855]
MKLPTLRPPSRSMLLRAAAITALVLTSVIAVIDHVALSRLSERTSAGPRASQIASLENRLAELAQQIESVQQQPPAMTQADFEEARSAIAQRLAEVDQAIAERPPAPDLSPLQSRIEQLEERLNTSARAAMQPPPSPGAPPPPPKASVPPFQVIGSEVRGGERFLTILPQNASAPSQARVLRPGDVESGWRLEAIENRTAVWEHQGEVRRLAVP